MTPATPGTGPITPTDAFAVKDCALIAIATGRRAATLRELRDTLQQITTDSIYYHFWGSLLISRFEEREYNNDFAAWARHGLHDACLAERLAVVDPTLFDSLDLLRQELIDLIDERLDESEYLPWVRASQSFEFIRAQIVVFDTRKRIATPRELADLMPHLSPSSVFYHFIDARRRAPDRVDDFRPWLAHFQGACHDLSERLANIDPYFGSLTDLRAQLVAVFQHCLAGAEP